MEHMNASVTESTRRNPRIGLAALLATIAFAVAIALSSWTAAAFAEGAPSPSRVNENMRTLTITYELPDGKEAAAPYFAFFQPGHEYSIASPQVKGYTATIPEVSGTMGTENQTITVPYTINTHTLTIVSECKYVSDFPIKEEVRTLEYGERFEISRDSVTVNMSTYFPTSMKTGGFMGDEDKTVYITYTYFWSPKILTIYFKDTAGKSIYPTKQLVKEREYSIWMMAPEIPGYTPETDTCSLSEGSYTFVYHKNESTTAPYKVQYFREQQDGSYVLDHEQTLEGTIGSQVNAYGSDDDIPGFSWVTSYIIPTQKSFDHVKADGSTTLRLYFYERLHKLTIHYKYEDGKKAANDQVVEGETGDAFSAESPHIPGYLPDRATVDGPMGDFSSETTVRYSPRTDMTYTANYYWIGDKETPLHPSDTVTNQTTGTTVNPEAPAIEGYTLKSSDHAKGLTISGDESKNVINFYYCKNASITITGESLTAEYTGETFSVDADTTVQVDSMDGGLSIEDVRVNDKPNVEGTDVGTYTCQYQESDIELLNPDYLFTEYHFNTGTLTITPKPITVQVQDASKVYGASDPAYKMTASGMLGDDDVSLITCTFNRQKCEDVGTYTVEAVGDAVQGNYAPTFLPGTLTITRGKMTIIIAGRNTSFEYDGKPHTIRGFDATPTIPEGYVNTFDRDKLSYQGTESLTLTDVGTATMPSLNPDLFTYNDPNVDVDFEIFNASTLTITPKPTAAIIWGATGVAAYDGQQHSISGYTVQTGDSLLRAEDIVYQGTGTPTATGTETGTYYMGLTISDFKCANKNFSVNIAVMDGQLEIQDYDAIVHISGNTRETVYNGAEQSVSGWTITSVEGPQKDSHDWADIVSYRLDASVTRIAANSEPSNMRLDADFFECTNEDLSVFFVVDADGWLKINPVDANIVVKAQSDTKEYDGTPLTNSGFEVRGEDQLCADDYVDATVEGTITNAGAKDNVVTAYAIRNAAGQDVTSNYTNVAATDGTLTVTRKPVTVIANDAGKAFGEDDPELTASVTGLLGDDQLTYTVTRAEGENAGTYKIMPAGAATQGNYKVTFKAGTFTIGKISYDLSGVEFADQELVYDMNNHSLAITGDLPEGVTVSYENNSHRNVGSYRATAVFTGDDNHETLGTKSAILTIAPQELSASNAKLSATKFSYNGKAKKPSVTVKSGDTILKSGTDYTVKYATGRTKIGTYKVTIIGKGNYTGTITKTFKVVPAKTAVSSLAKGSKSGSLTVKWTPKKSAAKATGVQIRYSTSSKFTKATTKTVTVKSYKTSSKTITKLKAKKKYYVQIRTYKTVNGTKYYSAWSKTKSATTK